MEKRVNHTRKRGIFDSFSDSLRGQRDRGLTGLLLAPPGQRTLMEPGRAARRGLS
jgi:hypothetical protein